MLTIWEAPGNTDVLGSITDAYFESDYSPTNDVEWMIDWGDGAGPVSSTDYYFVVGEHTYAAVGTYHVTATAVVAGVLSSSDLYVTITPPNPQGQPSGAVSLSTSSGRLHLDNWAGLPLANAAAMGLHGPTTSPAGNSEVFSVDTLEINRGSRVLWFKYVASQGGLLVVEATTVGDGDWYPTGVACSSDLYVLNQLYAIDYWPLTRGHMGVRVEAGKTYLLGIGIDGSADGYVDLTWNYQVRTVTGPCMYVLSGDAGGVLAHAVSLTGTEPKVDPVVWVTSDDLYPGRPAGTQDGRFYIGRASDTRMYTPDQGLIKATHGLLHVPPISVYDKGLYTEASELTLDWSDERQQLIVSDDFNVFALKGSDQKFVTQGNGWTFYDALDLIRTGDSFEITAPSGFTSTSIRVIAMIRYVIYEVGDTVPTPIPPYSGQVFTPAYSDYVTVAGDETTTITFPSVTYASGFDNSPVNHYAVVDSANVVLALVESVNTGRGLNDYGYIYALDESGTVDYWKTGSLLTPPLPWREGEFTYEEYFVQEWSGQHLRGNSTYWRAEIYTTPTVFLGGGSYTEYGGSVREGVVARYELGSDHTATNTLRWTPTYIDHSLEFWHGFRYFTINKDQTRLLVTYDKKNPIDDSATNPYHFNSWYTGGMWIQVYDLTAGAEPVFMNEFRFVPWPSLAGVYTSEPGFNTYEFYAYGVIEFDPLDDNYAFMINNSDRPTDGPYKQHQTYVFRIPLYEDYATQYAAMRTPWCTFDNSDADENYWFSFGKMGALPFSITGPSQSTAKFLPNA